MCAGLVVDGGIGTVERVGFVRRRFGEWLSLVGSLKLAGLVLSLTCVTVSANLVLGSVCLVGVEVSAFGLIVGR